jgi:hypothetical protein
MWVYDEVTMWRLVSDRQERLAAGSHRSYLRGGFRRRLKREAC